MKLKEGLVMKVNIPRLTPAEAALLRNCTLIKQERDKQERQYEIDRPAMYIELPPIYDRDGREERRYE